MLEVITYTMYLITITNIETANVEVHRLVFDNKAECVSLSKAINQERDPIVDKKNCRRVINYLTELP